MLPEALEAAFSAKTRAVIVVDAFGNPSGMGGIADICKARGVPLIEDAACAFGSSENGRRCGTIADMTCFSFHPRKLLTTGEGGAITTNDPDSVDWFTRKLSHGAQGMLGFGLDFVDFGYNFRMSEPQAIMGRVQLCKLDSIIAERNAVRMAYIEQLSPAGFIPQKIADNVVFNVQSLVFRVPAEVNRDQLISDLRLSGIEATIGTYCMSGTTYFGTRYQNVQPNADFLQKNTITLPCYARLDIDQICDVLLELVLKQRNAR
jgi:dTDP-4-amino-4,6-dideoxygalactose transaminase